MNTRFGAFKHLGANTVEVDGERLEYEGTTRRVVHNQKTKRYAMFLSQGRGDFIFVRPIKKNGELSRSKPFWTHGDNWYIVGEIQQCTAFRQEQPPNSRLGKFLFKTFSGGPTPACQWTERIEFWPEDRKVTASLWWFASRRERQEKESKA
jgi:hypothetical protein